jgi:hypothetical protein
LQSFAWVGSDKLFLLVFGTSTPKSAIIAWHLWQSIRRRKANIQQGGHMRRGAIFPALILILIGLWFLAGNLDVRLPGMDAMWPIFPLGGGLLFLGGYLTNNRRDPGLVFVGVGATLIGAFFFLFTLRVPLPVAGMQDGVRWSDMGKLWPAYVVIGGLSFMALFLAEPSRPWGVFSVGALAVIVGFIAFLFTLGWLPSDLGRLLAQYWPLLLILAGLAALLQAVAGRPRPKP